MLKQELYKLFGKKLIIILIGLCLLNIAQLYYLESKTTEYAADGEYKQIWSRVKDLAEESGDQTAYETIKEENEEKKQFKDYYYAYLYGYLDENNYDDNYLKKVYQRINEEKDLSNAKVTSECELYERVTYELESFVGYSDYLQSINDNAARLTTISIFKSKDSFANRNIEKTPGAYQKMKGIKLKTEPSKGVELFSKSMITDIIAIFLIMFCAVNIWTREKDDGIKQLLFTCYRGRKKLASVKLITMAIACFLIEIMLYGGNLFMAEKLYGIGDMSRYLPSVYAFSQTVWKISVLQYFVIFLLIKYIVYLSLAFIIFVITDICNNMALTFGGIMLVEAIGVLAYIKIPASSVLSIFKFLLPYGILRTEKLFMTYLNLNLFGFPIELTLCIFILLVVELSALPIILLHLYVRRRNDEKWKKNLDFSKVINKITRHAGQNVSIWYHELYKVFVTQKVVFILIILCIIQFISYPPKEETIGSIDELYYKQYLLKLSGPLTEEKEEYIKEEQEYFDELNAASIKMVAEGKSPYALQEKLKPYPAFQRVMERYTYLQNNKGAYFVYDIPYNEFTAGYNNQNDTKLALEYLLLIIICTAGIFGMDYQLRAEKLCSITLRGRYKEVFIKLLICIFINTVLLFLVYLPFILQNWNSYGIDTETLNYPVNSLPNLSHLGSGLNIGTYILLTYVFRFLFAIIISFAVCMIAFKVRNVVSTMLLSILIFALPTAFLLISEQFIRLYYPLSPILGNQPWTYSLWKVIILVVLLVVATILMLYRMIFKNQTIT